MESGKILIFKIKNNAFKDWTAIMFISNTIIVIEGSVGFYADQRFWTIFQLIGGRGSAYTRVGLYASKYGTFHAYFCRKLPILADFIMFRLFSN